MFRLQGTQSWLQPFNQEHLADPRYFDWLTDYEVVKTINRTDYITPVRFTEVQRYCEALMASRSDLFWAIHANDGDQFVGTLRVSGLDWRARTADVGILVGERAVWGRGMATDAIRTAGTYLFRSLGLRKLTAGVMAVNEPMLKVFLKLGFAQEGVLRQQDRFEEGYCDHIYLGCFRDEFRFADAEPRR